MSEVPDPAAATDAFARPIECDGPLYRQLLTRPDGRRYSAVVELGAGTGRLTALWLELSLTVIALEHNLRLRAALEQRFADAIASGQLAVLPDVADLSPLAPDTVFLAPYNVAYYFPNPVAFAAACQPALSTGTTIYFDVTDVADPRDGLPIPGRLTSRTVGAFREDVIGQDNGTATVVWHHHGQPAMQFVIHPHAPRDLLRAITAVRPTSVVHRVATGRDDDTPFSVFEIARPSTPRLP